ncbi:MAG: hypothetical protein Q4B50_02925 [Bacillota bacterium]|nr:hypothetical protein [Bacillota bacterium]
MLEISSVCSGSVTIIGLLALLIAVLTELTKNVGLLKKLPTDLQALLCGVLFAVAYMIYSKASLGQALHWYQLFEAVMQGLLAAFVAIYGWGRLVELWQRLGKRKSGEEGDEK